MNTLTSQQNPDRQKEITIAKRLGWTAEKPDDYWLIYNPQGAAVYPELFRSENEAWEDNAPCYLTDRNAAQEIIEAFANSDDWFKFSAALRRNWLASKPKTRACSFIFVGLLATPREICEAACEVWGMEESN